MKSKEFFGKFLSRYLWGNLIAMGIVVVLLCIGVKYGLDVYTKHGEAVVVPQLNGMDSEKAKELLVRNGLKVIVSDSGYNKRMPAGCVLMQTPNAGMRVKMGLTIFLTSHFMDEVEALCDEVCVLKQGRTVFRGTVEQAKAACGCERFEEAYLMLTEQEAAG